MVNCPLKSTSISRIFLSIYVNTLWNSGENCLWTPSPRTLLIISTSTTFYIYYIILSYFLSIWFLSLWRDYVDLTPIELSEESIRNFKWVSLIFLEIVLIIYSFLSSSKPLINKTILRYMENMLLLMLFSCALVNLEIVIIFFKMLKKSELHKHIWFFMAGYWQTSIKKSRI